MQYSSDDIMDNARRKRLLKDHLQEQLKKHWLRTMAKRMLKELWREFLTVLPIAFIILVLLTVFVG